MMTSTRLLCETRAHAVGRCNPLPLHGARTCPDRVEGLVLRRSLQMPHSMPLPVNRKHAVVHCHVAHSSNGHDPWVMPTLSSRCLRVYPLPVEPWPRSRKSTCLDKAWTICAGDGVALSHITTRYTHRAIVVSAPHSDPISVIVQRLRPNDTSNDAYTLHEQAYACKQVIPEDLAAYTGWCHRMFAPDFRKGVTQTDALQDYGVRFRAFGAAMKAKTASDAAARTPASTDGDAPNNSAEHEPSDARKIVNNIRQGTRTSAVLEKSGYHTMDEYCGSGLDIPVALRFVLQRLAAHVLEPEVLLFEATQLLEAALTNELIPCTVPCPACLRPYPILGARQHHRTCKRAPSVRATRPPQPGAEASEALPPAEFTP
eukprot:m.442454 g.442454  ORF g.442454 m.442454 type:complete len:372 (+) comp21476_c0_seq6:1350-2465(+)